MKQIFYPGNSKQPCVASIAVSVSSGDALSRAQALICEEPLGGNPGGTFCSMPDIPDFLVNRLLNNELLGCRIDLVEVYYAGPPDELRRRRVVQWQIKPDLIDMAMRGGVCDEVVYKNVWDRIKAKMGFFVEPIRVEANSYQLLGGTCRVRVNGDRLLDEDERRALLMRFGVLSQ